MAEPYPFGIRFAKAGFPTNKTGWAKVDERQVLGVWEFPRATDIALMIVVARARLMLPSFEVELLQSYGDTITVRCVRGWQSKADPLLYVERRGTYEILGAEFWGRRRLLVLRAYPSR